MVAVALKKSFFLLVLLVVGWFSYLAFFSGVSYFYAPLLFDGLTLKRDVVFTVSSEGVITSVRNKNVFDSANPFMKRLDGLVLPGLTDPFLRADCLPAIRQESDFRSWLAGIRKRLSSLFAPPFQPWITGRGELFAVDSIYSSVAYARFLLYSEYAATTLSPVVFPKLWGSASSGNLPPDALFLSSSYYSGSSPDVAAFYSPGLEGGSLSAVDTLFRASEKSKKFLVEVLTSYDYSDAKKSDIVSLYRMGLLSERTVIIVHSPLLSSDELSLLELANSSVILVPWSWRNASYHGLVSSLNDNGISWGVASGRICDGSPFLYQKLLLLREAGIDDFSLWQVASYENAHILGINSGLIARGFPADFVELKTDTLVLDSAFPSRLSSVFRKGKPVLDLSQSKKVIPLRTSIEQLRKDVDSLAREKGKYLGRSKVYSFFSPFEIPNRQ